MRIRRDVFAVADTEEVCGAALVDVLFGGRVKEYHAGEAFLVRYLARIEAGCIVTAHLDVPRPLGGRTVVVIVDDDLDAVEPVLVIRAYRRYEYGEQIVGRRFHAYLRTYADEHRTEVERCARTVGRNVVGVELHGFDACFGEEFHGGYRHLEVFARIYHALRILLHAEQPDLAVRAAECLEALEHLLSVVEAGRCHVDVHIDVFGGVEFAPLAVFVFAPYVVIGFEITESKL